jgi:FtsP/CotA-like multicopper oxidase with cupredoxin domain
MNRWIREAAVARGLAAQGGRWLAVMALLTAGVAGCGQEGTPAASSESPEQSTVEGAVLEDQVFADFAEVSSPWFEPPVIRPADGNIVLNVAMNNPSFRPGECRVDSTGTCGPAPCVRIPGGCLTVNLRSYASPHAVGRPNGLVGPTIKVKAGDVLKVDLRNELPADQGVCDPNQHHPPQCFDYTNLHTHGLHISPKDHSDNVLISVSPRLDSGQRAESCKQLKDCHVGRFPHEFKILPARDDGVEPGGDHYPGTFWYHAHRHGSTAVQLASGMAGALLVEDPEQIPELEGVRERIMVTQQLAFDNRGLVDVANVNQLRANWQLGRYTTINGVYRPRVPMCPGEVQRWRLIDGGIFEMVPVELAVMNGDRRVAPVEAQIIAHDGINRKQPLRFVTPYDMGPGYRVDVLVKAPERLPPGWKIVLRKSGSNLIFAGMTQPGNRQILAEVELQDAGSEVCRGIRVRNLLPPEFPLPTLPDLQPGQGETRNVRFSISDGKFQVNGRDFDHKEVHPDFQLKLGDTEDWKLSSPSGGSHPFHIHVNAFQVIRDGVPAEWRDTLIVPGPKNPEDPPPEITIRSHYERFDGTFVLHCHILHHEDLGMMQLVRIDK